MTTHQRSAVQVALLTLIANQSMLNESVKLLLDIASSGKGDDLTMKAINTIIDAIDRKGYFLET